MINNLGGWIFPSHFLLKKARTIYLYINKES